MPHFHIVVAKETYRDPFFQFGNDNVLAKCDVLLCSLHRMKQKRNSVNSQRAPLHRIVDRNKAYMTRPIIRDGIPQTHLIDTKINIYTMQSGLQCTYNHVEKCHADKCEFSIRNFSQRVRRKENRFTFSIISIHFINTAYDSIIMDEIMFDRLEQEIQSESTNRIREQRGCFFILLQCS